MALKTPNLDDRQFQDIVREARSKIPLYCPKWTDYNLSDPGITLIELFAWMVEMLLYRLNRVPEKNYIKFLDMIGLRLKTSEPARADITFQLSVAQPQPITIPQGTEVATVRSESQEAISFTTDKELIIIVPHLVYAMTTRDGANFEDRMADLKYPDKQVEVFKTVPEENDAMYLGFEESLSGQTLALNIDASIEGIGVDPHNPPLAWEYWNGERETWESLPTDIDTTGGLNTMGRVVFRVPYACQSCAIQDLRANWIRCRATGTRVGQRPYTTTPRIKTVEAEALGGTVPASHCLRISEELLGRSTGFPGQTYSLHNVPVLDREESETIEIETENESQYEIWKEVVDFSESGPEDRHFTLDSVSGEIRFGPSIRDPRGGEKQYGKIPAMGRRILFTSYRAGGGVIGNVGKETIKILKSSIPYIDSVTNYLPAAGGIDAETLESAMIRAPKLLRNQTRAVTADDFENLALESSPLIARAKCLSPGSTGDPKAIPPGVVRLLLVPRVSNMMGPLLKVDLEISARLRNEVHAFLDERRLLGMRVEIGEPEYQQVAIVTAVKVKRNKDPEQIKADILSTLYHYIHPVYGGQQGNGWPFGRSLFQSEIYSLVQRVPEVEYIEDLNIYLVDKQTGQKVRSEGKINIPVNCIVCSEQHEVNVSELEEY